MAIAPLLAGGILQHYVDKIEIRLVEEDTKAMLFYFIFIFRKAP